MKSKNNILSLLMAGGFLFMILQTGCSTAVKKPSISTTEAVEKPVSLTPMEAGISLSEITDPNQIPNFKDDYGRIELLYAIDNSRKYFEKIESYPESFESIGFTPEKQIDTLSLFRDGYVSSKSPQELTDFIAKNFRVFQVTGKENGGEVNFTGYGFPVFDKNVTRSSSRAYERNMDWKTSVYFGSLGLRVTPMRSIATGEGFFPPGGLAFAVVETGGEVGKSFFVLGHDTRSAINTAARVDVFCGIGKDALQKAENLNTNGKLYYLLKR